MVDIDIARLTRVLDEGQDAQRQLDAMGDQVGELRDALHRSKMNADSSRIVVSQKNRLPVAEITPEDQAKVEALTAQLARLTAHRESLMAELGPAIELARNFYQFARANRLQVGRYVF